MLPNIEPKGENINPKQHSPLTLAFLGDAVFELCVREKIISVSGSMPVHKLHSGTVKYVCASAQAAGMERILPELTEEEQEIFKRGRNANGNNIPKHASPKEYRAATGLETLFGFLYLKGEVSRVQTIFDLLWAAITAWQTEQEAVQAEASF